jgi:integrase
MASKGMSPEEFRRLLDATDNPRDKFIFRILAGTGLRSKELATLRRRNIDLEKHIILLENYNTKSHEARKVVIPQSLIPDIEAWISDTAPDDYIFPGTQVKGGKLQHITTARLRQIFYKAALRAGIQRTKGKNTDGQTKNDYSLHSLRHFHAVQSLKSSVPINSVQKQLGHSSLSTTQIYLDKSVEERVKDYNGFAL